MKKLFARAAASLSRRYRTMSIQMVISLSFTVAAVAGMVLMGLSLVWRFSAGTQQLVQENGKLAVMGKMARALAEPESLEKIWAKLAQLMEQ